MGILRYLPVDGAIWLAMTTELPVHATIKRNAQQYSIKQMLLLYLINI
jgi:hypothetical protein